MIKKRKTSDKCRASKKREHNRACTVAVGIFQRRGKGRNSFTPEGGDEAIHVAERYSMHAMNGDKVKAQLFASRRSDEPEARVVEIIESKERTCVGTLQVGRSHAFLATDDRTLAGDIFIPLGNLNNGKNGDKAVVKIIEWPEHAKNPVGEVVDILGAAGENTAEMHAILAEFGLPYKYPEAVAKAADKISATITDDDLSGREDFRNVTTFTIDPEDAKDFDDALSIRSLGENRWEAGVHIADVTHYVKAGDKIDGEAIKRATSVYLVAY